MSASCHGELRKTKGVLIFIPEGTDHYLRVDSDVALPEGFMAGKAIMTLVQDAVEVRSAKAREQGVAPAHGVPERVSGAVASRDGARVVIDAGFPLVVVLPDGATVPEGTITAVLKDPLRGEHARLV